MAPDERDRIFDQALARHLRSARPAGDSAGMPDISASQNSACPDPETLAAYHERSLLPEQLNSLKEHIVGCANCQTVLAHLETTDDIPLQAAAENQVFAESAAVATMSASRQSPAPALATLPAKSRRARLLRGARWQWLAPAGALAAGLLVWIALHENQPLSLPSLRENEGKIAQNNVPPAHVASAPTGASQPPASSSPAVTLALPKLSANERAISNGDMAAGAAKQRKALSDSGATRAANSLSDKELNERKDGARDAGADLLTGANQVNLDAKDSRQDLRKKVDVQSQGAATQVQVVPTPIDQIQNQSNYSAQKVPGPAPLGQAESSKNARGTGAPAPAAPAPKPAETGGAIRSYSGSTALTFARDISNPLLISPPASNLAWRPGRSGLIEFSKDGGSSWSTQFSGVLVDLISGTAPSDKVCWIVGRLGTVLLTTDGGAHWNLLSSPMKDDLGRVQASDALHARVWNSLNTKSLETSDGGVSWKP
jgi:hypothetical protein